MESKRIIILDLDETLIDTSERHYQVYCDINRILNLENLKSKVEFWDMKREGISTVEILDIVDENILNKFYNLWIKNIESKKYLIYDKLFNDTLKFLSALNKESLLVLTMRNNRVNLIWELKKLGIYYEFKSILSCSPITNIDKTIPLLEYAKKNGQNFNKNSIIIGDSETDIITGKKLKLKTLAVSYGIRTKEILLLRKPDYCVEDMCEIIDILKKKLTTD